MISYNISGYIFIDRRLLYKFIKICYICRIICKLMRFLHSRYILTTLFLVLFSLVGSAKDFVVVIDPGHGGKDYGAIGRKTNEKTINLNVALRLGEQISKKFDDVKVVYTRKTDKFISLSERASIANKMNGDLFISIHVNSVDRRNKRRNVIHGAATYTLGLHRSDENLDVAIRENAVIELEDDYTAKYQGFDPNSTESYIIFELSQNKHMEQSVNFASHVQNHFAEVGRKNNGVRQAGFWVLAKTSMPAVLIELDFICNPTQEKYLMSKSGVNELADAIFNAFVEYKEANDYYNKSLEGKCSEKKTHSKPDADINKLDYELKSEVKNVDNTVKNVTPKENEIVYKIQILTSGKKLSLRSNLFRKLDREKIENYYDKGLYKYTYFSTTDRDKALTQLKSVRKLYPEAFIVEFKNGKRIK